MTLTKWVKRTFKRCLRRRFVILKWFLLLIFVHFLLLGILIKVVGIGNGSEVEKNIDLIIQTVLHFEKSKFYPNNTLVILALGNEDILLDEENEIGCISANSNNEYHLEYSRPRPQYLQTDPTRACSFLNMIISCKTVPSPTTLYMFDSRKNSGSMVKLEYEEPVKEKLELVSCTSSIYFGERWQLYATSIEYHHYFGVTRQVYYLMSALQGVYQLLREYEKERIIDLRFWSVPDIPGLESLKQIWNRDQIGTLNDCFMRYREAADFIIVHDPDEFLWIKEGDNFYEKIMGSWTPKTVSLNVKNTDAEISSESDLKHFRIEQSLASIKFVHKEHPLKSIYKPDFVETVWVHWPLIYDKRMKRTWMNSDEVKFIHVRNWISPNESAFNESSSSLFPSHHLESISIVFKFRISRFQRSNEFLKNLTFVDFYYSIFDDCLRPSFDRCLSFELCRPVIPIFPNQPCVQYRSDFTKKSISKSYNFYMKSSQEVEIKNNAIGNWILISSTYYETSKFYEKDTVVLLLNADQSVSKSQKWICISKNETHQLVTVTSPRDAFIPVAICRMQTFVASCKSVRNPIFFGLTTKNFLEEETVSVKYTINNNFPEEKVIPIPIRYPVKEKYPLVSCFSPIFFNERWQLIVISIEFYRNYGVHLQDYYFLSATLPIFKLLKIYEKLKIVKITPWTFVESDTYEKFEMQYRNQAAAHSDCFLKYRESADFIIVSDIDDLLIPLKTGNLYKELLNFQDLYPSAAFFVFERKNSEIQVSERLKDFKISKSLKNIRIRKKRPSAKSVYNTKHVEVVWIHWAYLIEDGFERVNMGIDEGYFIHLRDWVFLNNKHHGNSTDAVIPPKDILNIEESFLSKLKFFPDLNSSTSYYYDFIDGCYTEFVSGEVSGCPTHLKCSTPTIFGLECAQSVSKSKKIKLSDLFSIAMSVNPPTIEIMENGCLN